MDDVHLGQPNHFVGSSPASRGKRHVAAQSVHAHPDSHAEVSSSTVSLMLLDNHLGLFIYFVGGPRSCVVFS
jgi:hypothetical protein